MFNEFINSGRQIISFGIFSQKTKVDVAFLRFYEIWTPLCSWPALNIYYIAHMLHAFTLPFVTCRLFYLQLLFGWQIYLQLQLITMDDSNNIIANNNTNK